MFSRQPEAGPNLTIVRDDAFDRAIAEAPNSPAVFLIWPRDGEPYLAKTALLRRRLLRLLKEREKPSRLLNLRESVMRVECWITASALESSLCLYELARLHFPKTYLELLRLRFPPYVKIVLDNPFPRSRVTTRIGRAPAYYYGPFRSRATAEEFEARCCDLFQMRRCHEDLQPSPEHPGCIYGEMGMCLRPCQQVVGVAEYGHEVDRVVQFLATGGRSLAGPVESAREQLSQEMNFEEAARQHKRLEKIEGVLRLKDELVTGIDHLNGVAVTTSMDPAAVQLWFVYRGFWQAPLRFSVAESSVSLDRRLSEMVAAIEWKTLDSRQRQEHLALLSRWYYSSWREGEWLAFDAPEKVPFRRLVRMISRVATSPGKKDTLVS
jgi:excinuclease UvrABC nuclease subunit